MSEMLDVIKERRSIRKFKTDMVDDEKIQKVIDAGLYAATGMNRQATKIIAVTNKKLRDEIAAENSRIMGKASDFDPFYSAPVILIVLSEKDVPTCVYDGSLALGNMMLEAYSLGLGSCWIHRAKEEFEEDFGKKILADLGIEGEYEGIGHLALGYADMELPPIMPRKENRVYFVK